VSAEASNGPGWRALAGVGAFLLALAVTLLGDATNLPPPQAVGVGPTAAMRLVAVLLAVLGVAHLVAAWQARAVAFTPGEKGNKAALAWVLGGLVGLIVWLQVGGGFVLGATWLFVATAAAFGQPIRLKSPLIGFVLALAVYAFFTLGLSLSLPAGPLERALFGAAT
jgi:putative tricarboxylic transport membrane protein